MRIGLRLGFFVTCALMASLVHAANAVFTVSWTPPTARVDNAPLQTSDLSGYEIYYTIGTGVQNVFPVTGGATKTATITIPLKPASTPYTIGFSISAIDLFGLKSAPSPIVNVQTTVQNALPGFPTNLGLDVKCDQGVCSVTVKNTP